MRRFQFQTYNLSKIELLKRKEVSKNYGIFQLKKNIKNHKNPRFKQQSQAAKQQPLQQIPHPMKNIHPPHDTPQSTLLPNLPVPQPMSLNKTTSVQTATTQAAAPSPATPATMIVPQDDCTWFGHSIAAQLRMMSPQLKELTKMRLQKV
jgi:hypothetical protein